MPRFDAEGSAILTRLSRSRVCSDETGIRVDGRICWNWVFQNNEVVIQLIRHSLGSGVVSEVMGGHRPALWVSDLYSARQGYADDWQICPAHQLRDCQFVVDAGDSVFAPRMKMLLLRAFVLARRRQHLAESMRRQYASAWTVTSTPSWPGTYHARWPPRRYGKLHSHLFTSRSPRDRTG